MCTPGVNPARTDKSIAQKMRDYLDMVERCSNILKQRGYTLTDEDTRPLRLPKAIRIHKRIMI